MSTKNNNNKKVSKKSKNKANKKNNNTSTTSSSNSDSLYTAKSFTTTMSLKLLVDSKANKVLFAEAGKDFVDFLFHIMSLPLGTVVKLLSQENMMGCLGDLYKSVQSLNTEYFQNDGSRDLVLNPKVTVNVPLLSLEKVGCGKSYVGYVKSVVTYMVMDNLEVRPMSTFSGTSLINKFQVKDVSSLEERELQIGFFRGLTLLKTSLETKDVLTTVFLGKKTTAAT